MSDPDEFKDYIDLSVDVFKAQDPKAIQALKNFLTVLSNTAWIEVILSIAADQLAEDAPEACRWLLQHPEYLQPEFNLLQKVQKDLLETLQGMRFVSGQDLQITEQRLQFSEELAAELRLCKSASQRHFSPLVALLIEEILH